MDDIDSLKRVATGAPKYRLAAARVFVSPGGYHYIDALDPLDDQSPEIDETALSPEIGADIERTLHSNPKRLADQVNTVAARLSLADARVLDIGCGGGWFLAQLKARGAVVLGIEPSDARACFAKTRYDLDVVKRPIESPYWQEHYSKAFDAVTLWDTIEHVNFPLATLRLASEVLKTGGYLFIDTPCRDSFYHRVGALTYWLSRGRFPTFLNAMYSAQQFGHKQIFSTAELHDLLEHAGFEVLQVKKFHELSFPYRFYLKKLCQSDVLTALSLPLVHVFLLVFPIKNKMLAIGRKR